MMFEELRQEVYECLLELPKNNLVTIHSGTVSGRDPDSDLVVIKPSGYSYEKLTPGDLVVVDLDGNVVEGELKPSSDTGTHLHLYRHRDDIHGVVHTHSPYACIFAVLGKPIPPCLTSVAMLGGEIPLGGYVPVGGELIGQEILDKAGDASAIVMLHHGVYTFAPTVTKATLYAAEVEDVAKITYFAMLHGDPIVMSPEMVAEFRSIYADLYGQESR
jgi:L-ribulose-5-phosphate 4-epimerase